MDKRQTLMESGRIQIIRSDNFAATKNYRQQNSNTTYLDEKRFGKRLD